MIDPEKQSTIKMRKLVVLGTSHQLQGKNFLKSIDDQCYRDMVEQLIDVHQIDFVFEEAAGHAPTDAELIVSAQSPAIDYMDVDPPEHERDQHQLSGKTGDGYMVDLWQTPPCVAETQYVDKHAAREEFWLKRIRGQDFKVALMVCGHAHCLSFSFRLRDAGFEIENCINYMPYEKLCGHGVRAHATPRILLTSGPDDWRKLLVDPDKQWKPGYSARTLANCWEAADGFPLEISKVLAQTTEPLLANINPLLAVPEFKVPLPGGSRASQNDVFVIAHSSAGPVCIMVEGKVNESFGPTLDEWRVGASPGKDERLDFLLETLGFSSPPAADIRYQLLHRAASAIIAAEQYRAVAAIVLVHSFSDTRTGWQDYEAFARLFGVQPICCDAVQRLSSASSVPLFGAWVSGDRSFLKT